uniref:Uncharacterized protein n=1 Tax=Eutreptiella gymnastica TaxID=73025 RepID=A0A7S4G4R9_9EUGL|mmetsp:Transcript_36724/g.61388  ORF Transcript_36724/g.61388 Transcript_36724/m.61388 type:complete len:159 (-) Transcript_36724:123-599(-)
MPLDQLPSAPTLGQLHSAGAGAETRHGATLNEEHPSRMPSPTNGTSPLHRPPGHGQCRPLSPSNAGTQFCTSLLRLPGAPPGQLASTAPDVTSCQAVEVVLHRDPSFRCQAQQPPTFHSSLQPSAHAAPKPCTCARIMFPMNRTHLGRRDDTLGSIIR